MPVKPILLIDTHIRCDVMSVLIINTSRVNLALFIVMSINFCLSKNVEERRIEVLLLLGREWNERILVDLLMFTKQKTKTFTFL